MKCELSCCLDVEEPRLADVTTTVQQLMGFLRDHGVNDTTFLMEFELALAEALNNAVEHGCAEGGDSYFHARLFLRTDFVELRVYDPSDFTGPDAVPELPEDPFQESGRGHFLMSQMADELIHELEDGRHVLVLRKFFKSYSWEYIPGASDEVLRDMTDEVVASYEMISTLLGLGEWLATAPDLNGFSSGALQRLCEVTEAEFAYYRAEFEGELPLLLMWGEGLKEPVHNLRLASRSIEVNVFRTGQEITLPSGSFIAEDDPLYGVLDSGVVMAVLFKNQRRGVLVLGRVKPHSFFEASKLKIARVVADYIGLVGMMSELQTRRAAEDRVLRDLEIAAQIQLSLMPQDFSMVSDLDFYGSCRPALQAGGDYFDVLTLQDGSVLCLVADVMGKGISAAILATMLRTNLYALVALGKNDPGQILVSINEWMSNDLIKLEMFVTIACVIFSPDRKMVRSAGAGHLPGLLQKGPGEFLEIHGQGVPVGIFPNAPYATEHHALEPGDRFIMLTDGITEASSTEEVLFENERLQESLKQSYGLSSQETVERLLADVTTFTSGCAPSDDRTVLIATRPR